MILKLFLTNTSIEYDLGVTIFKCFSFCSIGSNIKKRHNFNNNNFLFHEKKALRVPQNSLLNFNSSTTILVYVLQLSYYCFINSLKIYR